MLSKIKENVNNHRKEILLITLVVLISLFSFACGFLTANHLQKEPIIIENSQ